MSVLPAAERAALIEAWIKHTSSAKASSKSEHFWAFEAVHELIRSGDPSNSLDLIVQLLVRCDTPALTGALAAGPLEDLLSWHGPKVIDAVEIQARKDPKFRHLIGGVWKGGMSDEVWQRFRKIKRPIW
jgi:hypothetical protein